MKSNIVRVVAVTFGMIGMASCSSLVGPRAELAEARVRWSQRGPSSIASLHSESPHSIDVDYDAALGFPVSISVDMRKDYVDDEFSVRISSFTAN